MATVTSSRRRLYRRVLHHKLKHITSCFRVYRRSSMVGDAHQRGIPRRGRDAPASIRGSTIVEYPTVLSVCARAQQDAVLRTISGTRTAGRLAMVRLFRRSPTIRSESSPHTRNDPEGD
jgi:hypothetical protein